MKKTRRLIYSFISIALMFLLTACPSPVDPADQKEAAFKLELSSSSIDLVQGAKQTIKLSLSDAENLKEAVNLDVKAVEGLELELDTSVLSDEGANLSVGASLTAEAKTYTVMLEASTQAGLKVSEELKVSVKALSEELPVPDLGVDETVKPNQDSILDEDGKTLRPVGAISDGESIQADFVLNELLLATDDKSKLAAFLQRWNGNILDEIIFEGTELPSLYLVKLDPSGVDKTKLEDNLRELGGVGEGSISFSSESGLDLLAVAAQEMVEAGLTMSLNWIPEQTGIEEGSSAETNSSTADYTNDAFQWPYIKRGSAQDSGVDVAWQTLNALGKFELTDKVHIMVIDGGFRNLGDYGDNPRLLGVDWNTPNAGSCGTPCPWHGTQVAHTALGQLDNNTGVAGPGGPVSELEAIQFGGGFDIRLVARMFQLALPARLADRPDIINISASVEIPPVLNVGLNALLDPIVDQIHSRGTLIIASAGNDGKDVDEKVTFLGADLWEKSTIIPCETSSVICVGGLAWDSTDKESDSNYGSDREQDSVDIYASYTVWVPKVEVDGSYSGDVEKVDGTSFSSPFVAGVAALIKATNPRFEAQEIENCLLRSAHTDKQVHSRGGNQRIVDAFGAVACALPRDSFPLVKILEPTESVTALGRTRLEFKAFGVDEAGIALPVRWSSNIDGSIATFGPNTTFSTNALSVGTHTLTASVRDSEGNTKEDSIQVTITNNPPSALILSPRAGSSFKFNQTITLIGQSEDIDAGPAGLSDEQVSWRVLGTSFSATGHTASIAAGTLPLGTHNIEFTANDGEASRTDTVSIEITECIANCPTVSITSPAPNALIDAQTFEEGRGYYADVDFSGIATDFEDGTLSGKKMFWRVTNEAGQTSTICAPLTIGTVDISCGNFQHRLYTGEDKDSHRYVVTLTVTDSDGNSSNESIVITVRFNLI